MSTSASCVICDAWVSDKVLTQKHTHSDWWVLVLRGQKMHLEGFHRVSETEIAEIGKVSHIS